MNAEKTKRLLWVIAAAFAFVSAPAFSEVLELEGVVKAVDATARTLSVERKTPKGTKTLDLEVTKKAGDLSAVKVGDRISFSYDPDLEIVTKLGGQGDSDTPKSDGGNTGRNTISRVSVDMTSRGGLSIRLEKAPDEAFADPTGKKAELSGLAGARIFNDDGFFCIDIECDTPEVLAALGAEGLQVRKESLFVDTGVGKDDLGQRNFVGVKRLFGLPFTLQMDNARQGTTTRESPSHGGCSMNYNLVLSTRDGQPLGHAFITVQPIDPFFNAGKVFVSIQKPNEELKQVAERDITDGQAAVRVQMPGVSEEAKLRWWCVVRGEPVWIERVRIAGPVLPFLGCVLDGVAGQVSVKQVLENSVAAQAGIKTGDIVVSVNGQRVRDAESAVEAISSSPIGGEVTLKIKRQGKEIELKAKAS